MRLRCLAWVAIGSALSCGSSEGGAASGSDGGLDSDGSLVDGGSIPDGGGNADGNGSTTTLRDGLIHAYTFTSSTTLLDEVGTAHATSVKVSESGIASRSALRFAKAASDIIKLPNGMLGGLTELTLCIWLRADGQGAFFSWKGPSNPGGLLGNANGYMWKAGNNVVASAPAVDPSAWRLACGVSGQSLTGLEIYMDGQKLDQDPANGIVNGASDPVVIGADVSGANLVPKDYFEGAIDEVYLWNRGLTAAEIAELFALNTSRFW